MSLDRQSREKWLGLLIVLAYLVPRFVFDSWFRNLGNTSYLFEFAYCLAVTVWYRKKLSFKVKPEAALAIFLSAQFALGLVVYAFGMKVMQLPNPFDLGSLEMVFFLLILAPILEEWIFRHALWVPLSLWRKEGWGLIVLTSLLFSAGHFSAYFAVPPELQVFVLYQAFYTFVVSLSWGFHRWKRKTVIVAMAAHAAFNLGFWVADRVDSLSVTESHSSAEEAPPDDTSVNPVVLVIDLPVDPALVSRLLPGKPISILEDSDSPVPLAAEQCAEDSKALERWFESQAPGGKEMSISPEVGVRMNQLIQAAHGYHVLGLVAEQVPPGWKIFHLGLSPVPLAGISDFETYLDGQVRVQLGKVERAVRQLRPALVQLASSDTEEENAQDLLRGGLREEDAHHGARKIVAAWREGWDQIFSASPQTTFVVAAGNGGYDGVGDAVTEGNPSGPFPVALPHENLWGVASLGGDGCILEASNFQVKLAARGELVESISPCAAHPRLRLSGTSQASAHAASVILRHLASGKTVAEAASAVPSCSQGKITAGVF